MRPPAGELSKGLVWIQIWSPKAVLAWAVQGRPAPREKGLPGWETGVESESPLHKQEQSPVVSSFPPRQREVTYDQSGRREMRTMEVSRTWDVTEDERRIHEDPVWMIGSASLADSPQHLTYSFAFWDPLELFEDDWEEHSHAANCEHWHCLKLTLEGSLLKVGLQQFVGIYEDQGTSRWQSAVRQRTTLLSILCTTPSSNQHILRPLITLKRDGSMEWEGFTLSRMHTELDRK